MTLEEGKRDKYRLSLGGIAAPKENALIQSERFKKPPDALEEFLKNHPEIKKLKYAPIMTLPGDGRKNR